VKKCEQNAAACVPRIGNAVYYLFISCLSCSTLLKRFPRLVLSAGEWVLTSC